MKNLSDHLSLPQPKILDISTRLELKLRSLGAMIAAGIRPHDATDRFVEVYSLLEALPFTTDEFTLARNRLRNTIAFLHCGARRASLSELRMLMLVCGV